MAKYQVVKTFGHDIGLSCAFRQWRATSHCNKLHGYALAFEFTFEADELDERNWVVDFGDFKDLKDQLQRAFDHKTVLTYDDPELENILETAFYVKRNADGRPISISHHAMDIVMVEDVGCERFAQMAYLMAREWLTNHNYIPRVKLVSCKVSEHGANSAVYLGD